MKFSLAALCLLACSSLLAQEPQKKASCKANKQPPSPAMLAFSRYDYKTAAGLFASESAAAPADERLRSARIRNLIAAGEVDEATKQAKAFAEAQPDSAYALNALAETMMRNGTLPEAYATAARAQKIDPCNPRVYQTLFAYETMIAMNATAKRHIDLAHALDPLDAEITLEWINTLPRADARKQMAVFAETSPSLTDKQRDRVKRFLAKDRERNADECRLVSPMKETTVPFSAIRYSPDSDPAYGLEMTFNGKKRRLELDTGASGLLLTAGAAERLGLAVEEKAGFGGIGDEGVRRGVVTHVAHLNIGGLEFENCEVGVLPPRDTTAASYGFPVFMDDIDGLIGGDIFSRFLLTLDYPGGELKVTPLPERPGTAVQTASLETSGNERGLGTLGVDSPPQDRFRSPEMQDWTQFYRIYHYLLIPTQLDDGPVKLMMADTGASESIISPDAARSVTKVSTTSFQRLTGISGMAKNTYITDKIVLHFAGLYLPLKGMLSTETTSLSRGAGVDVSGFLGFTALKQLTLQIDYRDDLIHFVFDPKRKPNPKFARSPYGN